MRLDLACAEVKISVTRHHMRSIVQSKSSSLEYIIIGRLGFSILERLDVLSIKGSFEGLHSDTVYTLSFRSEHQYL